MRKKLLSLLLSVIMLISVFSCPVFAADSDINVTISFDTRSIAEDDLQVMPLIPEKNVTLPINSTVKDVFDKLVEDTKNTDTPFTYVGDTYITQICDYGDASEIADNLGITDKNFSYPGWMYYVNDVSPDVGFNQKVLSNGDNIEFRYTVYYGNLGNDNWGSADFAFFDAYDELGRTILSVDSDANSTKIKETTAYQNAKSYYDGYNDTYAGFWLQFFGAKGVAISNETNEISVKTKLLKNVIENGGDDVQLPTSIIFPAGTVEIPLNQKYKISPDTEPATALKEFNYTATFGQDNFTLSSDGIITPKNMASLCLVTVSSKADANITGVFRFKIVEASDSTENPYVPDPTPSNVQDDFENDIWLQNDFYQINTDDVIKIYPRRVPQIVSDNVSNNVVRPDFNFELVYGDSITLDKQKGDFANATAVKSGVSIVKVSYDPITYKNVKYGASSAINDTYCVFSVDANKEISISTDIPYTSYHTVYFKEGDSVDMPFTVTATEGAEVGVTLNGVDLVSSENGSYTAKLSNRSNILGIKAKKDGKINYLYKVIDARKIDINIENEIYPGLPLAKGDTALISFKGVTMPVYKLAAIYNPTWESDSFGEKTVGTYIHYNNDQIGTVTGHCEQLDLATNNTIRIKLNNSGKYDFTNGGVMTSWWGKELGFDKTKESIDSPSGISPYFEKDFTNILPDISFNVLEKSTAIPVSGIGFGKYDITLYKGQELTFSELENELGGVTIYPENASNKKYNWESSDKFALSILEDKIKAQKTTDKITLTAKTVDGSKIAVCNIKIIEKVANESDKEPLLNKINEAKAISVPEKITTEWTELQNSILLAERIYNKTGVTVSEIDEATGNLDASIKEYRDYFNFIYEFTKENVSNGLKITVNFKNMVIPSDSGNEKSLSWKTKFTSNIPDLTNIETENSVDSKDNLRKVSFVVPKGTFGTFKLTSGYIEEIYKETEAIEGKPPVVKEITKEHYKGKIPVITFKINDDSSVDPIEPDYEKVFFTVDRSVLNKNNLFTSKEVKLTGNETVWEITKRIFDENGISYKVSSDNIYNSIYILEIDGDGEFSHGSGSGWMFSVNGDFPQVSCNNYRVSKNDRIEWKYTKNYGSDIGGGGSTNPVTKPQTDILDNIVTTVITETVKADSNGTIKASISDDKIKNAIDKTIEGSKKEKNTDKELKISFKSSSEVAKKVEVVLSESSFKNIKNNIDTLTITTPLGDISIDKKSLDSIAKGTKNSVSIIIEKVDPSTVENISEEERKDYENGIILDLKIISDNKTITNFDGEIKVTIPYEKKAGKEDNILKVFYISESGEIIEIKNAYYDEEKKSVVFSTNHFSLFAIKEVQPPEMYTDVKENDWFFEGAQFALLNDIFGKFAEKEFKPNETVSRGLFVHSVYNFMGKKQDNNTVKFKDVAEDSPFKQSIAWAYNNGAIFGVTEDMFNENGNITREQALSVLYRVSGENNEDFDISYFTDCNEISEYALPALKWAVKNNIIVGTPDNKIMPNKNLTRAEISLILRNYSVRNYSI